MSAKNVLTKLFCGIFALSLLLGAGAVYAKKADCVDCPPELDGSIFPGGSCENCADDEEDYDGSIFPGGSCERCEPRKKSDKKVRIVEGAAVGACPNCPIFKTRNYQFAQPRYKSNVGSRNCCDLASFALTHVDFKLSAQSSDNPYASHVGNYRFRIFGCRRESKKAYLNHGRVIQKNMRFNSVFARSVDKCYKVMEIPSDVCLADESVRLPEYVLTAEITNFFMNVCDEYNWDKAKKANRRDGSAEMTVTWRLMNLSQTKVFWKGVTTGYSEVENGVYEGEIKLTEEAFADATARLSSLPGFEEQLRVRPSAETMAKERAYLVAYDEKFNPGKCCFAKEIAYTHSCQYAPQPQCPAYPKPQCPCAVRPACYCNQPLCSCPQMSCPCAPSQPKVEEFVDVKTTTQTIEKKVITKTRVETPAPVCQQVCQPVCPQPVAEKVVESACPVQCTQQCTQPKCRKICTEVCEEGNVNCETTCKEDCSEPKCRQICMESCDAKGNNCETTCKEDCGEPKCKQVCLESCDAKGNNCETTCKEDCSEPKCKQICMESCDAKGNNCETVCKEDCGEPEPLPAPVVKKPIIEETGGVDIANTKVESQIEETGGIEDSHRVYENCIDDKGNVISDGSCTLIDDSWVDLEGYKVDAKLCIVDRPPYAELSPENMLKIRGSVVEIENAKGKKGIGLVVSDSFILTSAGLVNKLQNQYDIKTINGEKLKAKAVRVNPSKNTALMHLEKPVTYTPLSLNLELPAIDQEGFISLGLLGTGEASKNYMDNSGKIYGYRYSDTLGTEIIVDTLVQNVSVGSVLIDKLGTINGISNSAKQTSEGMDLFIPTETALRSVGLSICEKVYDKKSPWQKTVYKPVTEKITTVEQKAPEAMPEAKRK